MGVVWAAYHLQQYQKLFAVKLTGIPVQGAYMTALQTDGHRQYWGVKSTCTQKSGIVSCKQHGAA